MSSASDDTKVSRPVKLLLSMHDPRIASRMQTRGFDEAEIRHGWALVDAALLRDVPTRNWSPPPPSGLVTRFDSWENLWFDVIVASLRLRYPDIHARLIGNLHKTEGVDVVVNMRTLNANYVALCKDESPDAVAALALLAKRGVDFDTLGALVRESEAAAIPVAEPDPAIETKRQAALDELWNWYLEWATIARSVIKNRALLVKMGLAQPRRSAAEAAEPSSPEPDDA